MQIQQIKVWFYYISQLFLAVVIIGTTLIVSFRLIARLPTVHQAALDYLRPNPMDYFWDLNLDSAVVDIDQIKYYANYFEHLKQLYPDFLEVDGVLGYCAWYLGQEDKALAFFLKAIEVRPMYFWNYYNAAVIYANRGDHFKLMAIIDKLKTLDPGKSIVTLFSSKVIYLPMVTKVKVLGVDPLVKHMQQGYQNIQLMMNEESSVAKKWVPFVF